eukprot:403345140
MYQTSKLGEGRKIEGQEDLFEGKYDYIAYIAIVMFTVLYSLQIIYIYRHRKDKGIINRSPMLILVGGVALLVDSNINFGIALSSKDSVQCLLGIYTTVSNYYIAWAAIALRAYRLRKVFDCYNLHLKSLETNQGDINDHDSTMLSINWSENQETMDTLNKLQEVNLIKLMLLIFILPNFLLGVIAAFIPYAYMLIPVYETQQCLSYYRSDFIQNQIHITMGPVTLCVVKTINNCVFVLINWLQTLSLILLFFRLRNIKDELNIRIELRAILFVWILFSLLYFTTLQIEQAFDNEYSKYVIFVAIQFRNALTYMISTYFCYKMIKNPLKTYAKPDYPSQLTDFEEAIFDSILPYKFFKKYLETYQPGSNSLLTMATTFRKILSIDRTLRDHEYETEDEREKFVRLRLSHLNYFNVLFKENRHLFERSASYGERVDININNNSSSQGGSLGQDVLTEQEIERIYHYCLIKLKIIYKDQFIGSNLSKQLIQELSHSVIEFRYLKTAGLIEDDN